MNNNYLQLYLLSGDNMNALNGASKFVKEFCENSDIFTENGISLKVISNSSFFNDELTYKTTLKFKIKRIIKKVLTKSGIGNVIKLNYRFVFQGKKIVKQFMCCNPASSSIVIINDMVVAKEFYSKFKNKYKTIFMLHNSGDLLSMLDKKMTRVKLYKQWLTSTKDLIYKWADYFVCVAEPAKKQFASENPNAANKTFCINIGQSSVQSVNLKTNDLHIVCVGTICERKNQISIIKAMKKLNDKTIKLSLVGDGPMIKECKGYVIKNNMQKQVDFCGAQNNVFPFLRRANLFVLASFDEGLPISAQEAMNVGLPIVITDVGGCKELVDGNGILIKPDISELVNALTFCNENKNILAEWGNRSKEIFESKYAKNVMYDKYIKLINNIAVNN